MKQSVISTSCELHGLMPSSFCTRDPQSLMPRTVTWRLLRGTTVQCDAPRMVMPLTSMLFPWIETTWGVGPLRHSQSEPSRMPRPAMRMLSPCASTPPLTTAPPARYSVWLLVTVILSAW